VVTRSNSGVDGTSASLSGADLFLVARTSRRVRLPASLRRGRHRATGANPVVDVRAGHAEKPAGMYLVDVDGEAETSRIALRRRFEDIADGGWSLGTYPQESVAG
jgi:hypothetical protein